MARSASRHEYLSVAVADPHDKEKTSYVAIERGRGDPDPQAIPSSKSESNIVTQPGKFPSILVNASRSSLNASLSSLSSVSDSTPDRLADDTISMMPNTSGKWKVQLIVLFPLETRR